MAKKKVSKKATRKVPKLNLKKSVKKKVARKVSPQELIPDEPVPMFAKNEVLAGDYCNIALLHHTEREFVMDFIFAIANQHSLVSRVITSPQHMKKIYEVLGDNIKQYEKKYGEIK